MNFENPLPSLAVVLACMLVARLILAAVPFYRDVAKEAGGRHDGVDGLRGFLAIGVFLAHVVATWVYYTDGAWGANDNPVFALTGEAGVSLFFMITGFLFWGKVLASPGGLDVEALYRSRLRRIVPMYAASVLAVLGVVAVMSGFRLNTGLHEFLRDLRPWLSFGFMDTGDLNGVDGARYINPVYWTLAFEWVFYISLPFLTLFARGRLSLLMMAIAVFFALRMPVALNFVAGAVAAWAVQSGLLQRRLASSWATPPAVAALFAGMQFSFSLPQTLLLFVFFMFVVGGNTLWGLLRTPAAKLLGTVSYSFYLVHSIVLFVVMRLVGSSLSIAALTPAEYWLLAGLAGILAVLVSACTFRYVEYPFFARRAAAASPDAPSMRPAYA
jgi:peptidoglycan/LPS O-acetylase OafA/YrhL